MWYFYSKPILILSNLLRQMPPNISAVYGVPARIRALRGKNRGDEA